MEDLTLRRIRPEDGELLRELRLRSLLDAPNAFGQSVSEASMRGEADWQQQARQASSGDRRAWYVAEGTLGAAGLVQGRRRPPRDLLVFSMWVDPQVRRAGVGRRLIETVEAWGIEWGAARTVLWVFGSNEPAIRFYRSLGFEVQADGEDAEAGRNFGALAMARPVVGGLSRPVSAQG
jgi:GNAT superfamily N-acetyltransferase